MILKLNIQTVVYVIKKVVNPFMARIGKLELKHGAYEGHFAYLEQRINDAEQNLDGMVQ